MRQHWMWLAAVAGAVLVVVVAILLIGNLSGSRDPQKKTHPADSVLQVIPPSPMTFKPGDTKPVVVTVVRRKFTGAVKVQFIDLPEAFTPAEPVVIGADQDKGELRLTVRHGAADMTGELRLVAVAENLKDETTMPCIVQAPRLDPEPPLKKKGKKGKKTIPID